MTAQADPPEEAPAAAAPAEPEQKRGLCRITNVALKAGKPFAPRDLTLAIGPNNGGKSQFLKDLVRAVTAHTGERKAVGDVDLQFPRGPAAVMEAITNEVQFDENAQAILDAPSPDFVQPQQLRLHKDVFQAVMHSEVEGERENIIKTHLGRHLISHLTTERRLMLVKRQDGTNPNILGAQTPMEAAFLASPEAMAWVNERVHAAFATRLVIDTPRLGTVEFRLGDPGALPKDDRERRHHISELPRLDDQGDGIRSFCGILVTLAFTSRPIVLIDEPESFLHPPQARLIGKAIAEWKHEGAQVFIATHSAEVLQGVLSVSTDTSIVRFSKSENTYLTKRLNPEKLKQITDDPVLSSARILDGLFYQAVSITESDGDAVVYGNLLAKMDPSASIGQVNSYSKQASAKVARPFLALGVPCAVLVDFDMLRVRDEFRAVFNALGGKWADVEEAYNVLVSDIEGLDTDEHRLEQALARMGQLPAELAARTGSSTAKLRWLRGEMRKTRESASAWAGLKKTGVSGLPAASRENCETLLQSCADVGLFIAPCGEREAWLVPDVQYTTNKHSWTVSALTHLAKAPLSDKHALSTFVRNVVGYCSVARAVEAPEDDVGEEVDLVEHDPGDITVAA